MRQLIDSIRSLAERRHEDAQLALLIVGDALKVVMPAQELTDLAQALPIELALLLRGQTPPDEGPAEELQVLDRRTIEVVCWVLAAEGPDDLRTRMTTHVAPLLARHLLRGRADLVTSGLEDGDSARETVRVGNPGPV